MVYSCNNYELLLSCPFLHVESIQSAIFCLSLQYFFPRRAAGKPSHSRTAIQPVKSDFPGWPSKWLASASFWIQKFEMAKFDYIRRKRRSRPRGRKEGEDVVLHFSSFTCLSWGKGTNCGEGNHISKGQAWGPFLILDPHELGVGGEALKAGKIRKNPNLGTSLLYSKAKEGCPQALNYSNRRNTIFLQDEQFTLRISEDASRAPSQLHVLELIEVEIEVPANPSQEYAVPFYRV